MGVPQIPALLILDPEYLSARGLRLEDLDGEDIDEFGLGTKYVKRDGVWCAEGSQSLGTAQCLELDAAYDLCSRNGNEGMDITLYHLGFRDDPVRARVIDVDGIYTERRPDCAAGPPPQRMASLESDMYAERDFREDIRGETFSDNGFHGVTDCRFRDCCFEGPALRNTSGVVALNCVFGDTALHNSRNAFAEGEMWDLGNVKDSVVVVQFFGESLYPRYRNRGSLIVLYSGHGIYGREGNVISVPYYALFGKRRKRAKEIELARKLFRLKDVKRGDFPEWFLDRYWGKKLYRRGPDGKKAEATQSQPVPEPSGNGRKGEAAMMAALRALREPEALPDKGPKKWDSYDDMRDEMLRFFGEENRRQLEVWRRGEEGTLPNLTDMGARLNRRMERMGYPVRGKEMQYLEEMGRINRVKKAMRKDVPDKAPPEEGDGAVKA